MIQGAADGVVTSDHLAAGLQAVPVAAQLEPAGLHGAAGGEVVPAAVDLLPAIGIGCINNFYYNTLKERFPSTDYSIDHDECFSREICRIYAGIEVNTQNSRAAFCPSITSILLITTGGDLMSGFKIEINVKSCEDMVKTPGEQIEVFINGDKIPRLSRIALDMSNTPGEEFELAENFKYTIEQFIDDSNWSLRGLMNGKPRNIS